MGPAWFGKIYNKLETILVEVDTFTSQVLSSLRFHCLLLSNSVQSNENDVKE